MKVTLAQFVRKAWEYIDHPNKWITGHWHDQGPGGVDTHCAVGALEMAGHWMRHHGASQALINSMHDRARGALEHTIHEVDHRVPIGFEVGLMTYNDSLATHKKLEQLWEKTAIKLEEAGK